jgi:hypothetical protein
MKESQIKDEYLNHLLDGLQKDFDELGIEAASAQGKEKTRYANSRNNIAKTMLLYIAFKHDPKYISLSTDERSKDYARLLKAIKEKENQKKLEAQNQIEKRQLMTYKVWKGAKKTTNLFRHFEDLAKDSSGRKTRRGMIKK